MKKENHFIINFVYPLLVGLILAYVSYYFFSNNEGGTNQASTVESENVIDSTINRNENKETSNIPENRSEGQSSTTSIQPQPQAQKRASSASGNVNIINLEDGSNNLIIESYIRQLVKELKIQFEVVSGTVDVDFSPSKSIADEITSSIKLSISIDNELISIPTLYGRGDHENEAIENTLSRGRKIISDKLNR